MIGIAIKSSVHFGELLPADQQLKLGQLLVKAIQRRVKAGFGADGSKLPPGITLIRSGLMLASLRARPSGKDSVVIRSGVDYAGATDARHPWAGVAPQDERQLHAALEDFITKALKG